VSGQSRRGTGGFNKLGFDIDAAKLSSLLIPIISLWIPAKHRLNVMRPPPARRSAHVIHGEAVMNACR
jgi:hypothetical protein